VDELMKEGKITFLQEYITRNRVEQNSDLLIRLYIK
jgi:hypothetical protein